MTISRHSSITDVRTNTTYEAELGVIEHTHLGPEDHGVFTFTASWSTGGTGQGFGGHAFDEPSDVGRGRVLRSGYGLRYIQAVMKVAGVTRYEDLVGRQVVVLRKDPRGLIVGLAHATQDIIVIFDTDIPKED